MKSEPMTVHNYVKNILYFEFGIIQTFTNYTEVEYILFDHYILFSLQINFQINVTVEKCIFLLSKSNWQNCTSHIPRCYSNWVTLATTVIRQ